MTADERIRAVATGLFFERGYHGTTMREIGKRAGMKAASLYNHYPGKQQLFHRIVADTTRALIDEARARIASCDDPEQRLRALIDCHVRYHVDHRLAARVSEDQLNALEPPNRSDVVALRDEYERLFKEILRDGQERAGWRVPDVAVVASGIATMCTQVAGWFREGDRLSAGDVARIYADFALSGVAPATARA
jgi:AcrR family transcriptional regulator